MEPASELPLWTYAAATVLGYLLGSIPFGLLLTKAAGLGDIRNIGSGNIAPRMCCGPATSRWPSRLCCSMAARVRRVLHRWPPVDPLLA
jgi:hypothetical protein